jgi:hypothetical protein
VQAKLRKEPIANEGADDSYEEDANDSKPGTLHDLPGQPSGNETEIRRLSPDMCIFVSSRVIKPLSARLRAAANRNRACG